MLQFPQLTEAEYEGLRGSFDHLVAETGATAAFLIEKAGYLILSAGEAAFVDPVQLATLAANAFAATEFLAKLLGDNTFKCMFQQGDNLSVLWRQIDETCLMVIVFPARTGVGFVRYHANAAAAQAEKQLAEARARTHGKGLDLSGMNPTDISTVFKRKDELPH